MPKFHPPSYSHGFTLVEAIMVIVITGVISSMVAVFIKSPVDSYFDAARRAELTDIADTAVRRMARDIHLALPNSVRNPSTAGLDQCIEFIPTRIGGRYRMAAEAAGGNIFDFTTTDDKFDMLWLNSALPAVDRIVAGDVVVVFNDGSSSGNAYSGLNAIQVASLAEDATAKTTAITFVGTGAATPFNRKQLPSESPANRFQVIPSNEHVVAFRCDGGVLYRHSRKLTAAWAQPADCAAMAPVATAARLAQNLSTCSLHYDPPGSSSPTSRFGIVSISLGMTQSGETVSLYHQIHVDNTP